MSIEKEHYDADTLRREAQPVLEGVRDSADLAAARRKLRERICDIYDKQCARKTQFNPNRLIRARDCYLAFSGVLNERSDAMTGFSCARALWDIASDKPRPDLQDAFYAEMIQWSRGLLGRTELHQAEDMYLQSYSEGRAGAIERSATLDQMWAMVEARIRRYPDGLEEQTVADRKRRTRRIMSVLGATEDDWRNWKWHVANRITTADELERLIPLTEEQRSNIDMACAVRLPLAITPYYVSLMDEHNHKDRAVRAQVIPPRDYVEQMEVNRRDRRHSCDFMLEKDTSPIDLITRRYPAIAVLKPCNTCPQICVYCQRNWEIEDASASNAIPSRDKLDAAIKWIADHPAIREVLVTGGDPLILSDDRLRYIMDSLAAIDHVRLIRVGTRTLVTVPMRTTDDLAAMLGSYRRPGRREVIVMTHVEHPYEITWDAAAAVDRLKRQGISVYNQHVYTFYVSRRFECTHLRLMLRRIGIDPYYSFAPKGKEETAAYRVPIARMLQEQKEEARLVPGSCRTDEVVYNIPGLGKNYLRAYQHRNLLTVFPDGSRGYEFHPWEKNVAQFETFVTRDVPILNYLKRLESIGENIEDYHSIWYYL